MRGHGHWYAVEAAVGPVGQYGGDAIFDVLPFGRLWYGGPDATTNGIRYVKSIEEIRIIL